MGKKLGELLIEKNLVSKEKIAIALKKQKEEGGRLGSILVNLGFISDKQLIDVLSEQFGVPAVDINNIHVDENVLKLIPQNIAEKLLVFPFKREGKSLHLVMANPSDIYVAEDIKFLTGFDIIPYVASENMIKKAIEKYYGVGGKLAEVLSEMEKVEIIDERQEEEEEQVTDIDAAPVVKLVDSMISEAVKRNASDIHIEPYKKVLRVRFRIDGVLHEAMAPQYIFGPAIVSRIKLLAKLDIANRRLPQDGHINMRVGQEEVDLRVSTLPVTHGEKVVIRIAKKSGIGIEIESLGLTGKSFDDFINALSRPNGIILVTGPTGSGKTVTLYSALNRLNKPGVNIMTAEDPVEYDLHGINQVNVKEEIGLNFSTVLRAFLRQDPDIIMVGEIRDKETAEIAIRAALTGHLVLSTLHTNDTASSIARLIDMGIPSYLISSSLILVEAQRLVRKICNKCKKPYKPTEDELLFFGIKEENVFYKGEGCLECNNTGYKGRIGIFEVLPITPTIRRMIVENKTSDEIFEAAKKEGMKSLREDGLEKVLKGITTTEEVIRVTVQ
uniref:Type IV-A pilus assembly ATPase PilB n=1 Tax=candidate division WOR-3 bacterium TaxID=2052148 RepID=A0A7C4YHP5_UNCW3